jgi:phosphate acetyltransferase
MERRHEKYERLIARCKPLPPLPTAVAHPCDESSLRGAVEAARAGLIAPILVGPRARIEEPPPPWRSCARAGRRRS